MIVFSSGGGGGGGTGAAGPGAGGVAGRGAAGCVPLCGRGLGFFFFLQIGRFFLRRFLRAAAVASAWAAEPFAFLAGRRLAGVQRFFFFFFFFLVACARSTRPPSAAAGRSVSAIAPGSAKIRS